MTLKEWMEREGKTQLQVAEELGVDQGYVSRLCAGKHSGGAKTIAAIYTMTGGEVTPADMLRTAA